MSRFVRWILSTVPVGRRLAVCSIDEASVLSVGNRILIDLEGIHIY
jgi:hypothetical protein